MMENFQMPVSHDSSPQAHICVLISCLDFVSLGYDVHLVADGVSSVNKEEIPYAFDRMRQAGVIVGTSESIAFQLQRPFPSYFLTWNNADVSIQYS